MPQLSEHFSSSPDQLSEKQVRAFLLQSRERLQLKALLDAAELLPRVSSPVWPKRYRGQAMSVVKFIRRWLQHVCPSGLHRVRHYGFLNAHSRRSVEELRLLIAVSLNEVHYLACMEIIVSPASLPMTCSICGGPMLSLGFIPPPPSFALPSRAPP